ARKRRRRTHHLHLHRHPNHRHRPARPYYRHRFRQPSSNHVSDRCSRRPNDLPLRHIRKPRPGHRSERPHHNQHVRRERQRHVADRPARQLHLVHLRQLQQRDVRPRPSIVEFDGHHLPDGDDLGRGASQQADRDHAWHHSASVGHRHLMDLHHWRRSGDRRWHNTQQSAENPKPPTR
ncbi:MAG: hypothetical protein FD127_3655, partial [Acidimicrobiaceae bacterium]